MNDYFKAVHGQTVGYKIAKEFHNWIQLTPYEEQAVSPKVVKLAELIDSRCKEK